MNKTLVLAEKPSVGRDLARVLQCNAQRNGYLEGDRYIVTWALGHLVTLADPEAYNPNYQAWRIEDLPMLPAALKLVVIKKTGKQFAIVKEQLQRSDVSAIVIATDAGREGELVARWILDKTCVNKPVQRLWISSVTDQAIRDGFTKLRAGKDYETLYQSAAARAEADWLVGINATRALTCKHNAQLSCGRVQTPTLAIIAQREQEIQNFKPQPFYGLTAHANGLRLTWQDSRTHDSKTFVKAQCDQVLAASNNKTARIVEVKKAHKKQLSPLLYDLTELQRDANRLFGYSAKDTLSIMQRLYESHKLLTYPRTDSRYISADIVATLKERVNACGYGPYAKAASAILRKPIQAHGNFVNDNKVSDHHAIIPTEQAVRNNSLTDKEKKIYDLVIKRFLSVLYPAFEYEQMTLKAQIGTEFFVAKGKTVLALGWKEITSDHGSEPDTGDDVAEQNLPRISEGDVLAITSMVLTTGATQPPPLFNEGSLLSVMENPVRYMNTDSEALKKTLGASGGLGTVATRADIIEKLFNSFLIEKKGRELFVTAKGKQLLALVPPELKSPLLTAQWEQKLGAIAKGSLPKTAFVAEMRTYAAKVVNQIKNSQAQFKHDNVTRTKCPECGQYLLEVKGKKGKMLVCSNRDCGYRKGVALVTNARCPECHKKLTLRGEGEAKLFVCTCGYREKMTAFQERKKVATNALSKRDVSHYLNEQQKSNERPLNTALAEALAKLNL